ncbi:tyrosine-type recombinase/integrase [Brotonthovivens ammoniilytica]|uniref:tyrosine-type recombinase/integrase n=1 Tax=Brotonthovivens ammoniilytica TaxID=2981725 RepID=UPI002ED56076
MLNILANCRKVKTEMIVDGYSNFILIDKDEHPRVALHIDQPLLNTNPHVFRHTFCTNMANAGMDVKTLQYLMGHLDVGVTLNIYTHASYDRAAEQMAKIIDFKQVDKPEQRRKSG